MRHHISYRVLGLSSASSKEEIREAYRKKIKEFHPDVYQGDVRYVLVVREAYESLVNKRVEDRYMEDLAEELFPQGAMEFTFPELRPLEKTAPEWKEARSHKESRTTFFGDFSSGGSQKAISEKEWRKYAFPKCLVPHDERTSLVTSLLKKTGNLVPPVNLEHMAAYLGVHVDLGSKRQEKQLWQNYSRSEAALYGGTIVYDRKNIPHIMSGNILTPHLFYQRYVTARLLAYFLYYPLCNRSIMVGDFLSFFSTYDEEEINTHRLAEELLVPSDLFSSYGGKVLWYMERGKEFSYENFVKKTADLFQAPQTVVEHQARKFERRIRIAGSMRKKEKGKGLFKEIEGFFQ